MIKAKKSLGQNFLIDPIILNKIVDLVNIQNKAVLEIPPNFVPPSISCLTTAPNPNVIGIPKRTTK